MIERATTPAPAAIPGGQAGGRSAARDAAPGFADLVGEPGSGRKAAGAAEESEGAPAAEDGPASPEDEGEGGSGSVAVSGRTVGTSPSRPAAGLHEVLASLLGKRGAQAGNADGPAPDAPPVAGGTMPVAAEDAPEPDEEEVPAGTIAGTAGDTEAEDAPAAAVAAAILLPLQPRDPRPAGAAAVRPAGPPAPAASAAPAEAPREEAAEEDGAPSGGERRGEAAPDAGRLRPSEPEAAEMKVRVIAETAAPAPGPAQTGRTIADLAATLASESDWKGALERAAASRADAASAPAGPVRDLRIQLNPAELGSVDARLRIVGEQLSVEIRVEGGEAFRRLSSEKDAILTALRGLGFAVDDVSIQQQSPATGQVQAGAGGRQGDPSGGMSQGAGRGHQGDGGAAGGRPRGQEQGGQNGDARTPATRPAGGGLYI